MTAMPNEWRPIETAPRDGTNFLAIVDRKVRVCYWGKTSHVPLYGFCLSDQGPEDCDLCEPTGWMPLPLVAGTPELNRPARSAADMAGTAYGISSTLVGAGDALIRVHKSDHAIDERMARDTACHRLREALRAISVLIAEVESAG